MRSSEGVSENEAIQRAMATWSDVLFLSGYALVRRPIDEAGAKAAGAVRAQGGRVAVDLASWSAIQDFGARRFEARLAALEPDVVFAGERELATLEDLPSAPTLVVKRGPAVARVTVHFQR